MHRFVTSKIDAKMCNYSVLYKCRLFCAAFIIVLINLFQR